MRIWICNPFDNLPEEGFKRQRYSHLSRALALRGHQVVWFTSDFSHSQKSRRKRPCGRPLESLYENEDGVVMALARTLPYRKNVSPKRILSHVLFARTWEKTSARLVAEGILPSPDVILISTPPISLYRAAAKMRKRWNSRIVLDVMDIWPDAFESLFPPWGPSKILLAPVRRLAAKAMKGSDAVSATSPEYLAYAASRGASCPLADFPHTSDLKPQDGKHPRSETRIAYIGNMGSSYDLDTVIEAARMLGNAQKPFIFEFAGSGPDMERLKDKAKWLGNVRFRSFLDRCGLEELLSSCDIGLIPIFPSSGVAIPYKLADYAACGLAVISSLGGETLRLIESYKAGKQYACKNPLSLANAIKDVARDEETLRRHKEQSLLMAREKLSPEAVFGRFAAFVEGAAYQRGLGH